MDEAAGNLPGPFCSRWVETTGVCGEEAGPPAGGVLPRSPAKDVGCARSEVRGLCCWEGPRVLGGGTLPPSVALLCGPAGDGCSEGDVGRTLTCCQMRPTRPHDLQQFPRCDPRQRENFHEVESNVAPRVTRFLSRSLGSNDHDPARALAAASDSGAMPSCFTRANPTTCCHLKHDCACHAPSGKTSESPRGAPGL